MLDTTTLAPRIYEAIYGWDKNDVATSLQIMQFTGLKDKNGKEIYEGDIVMLNGSKVPKVMEFRKGSFCLDYIYFGTEAYRMEVIGNIYENPELIK
jgi:uncharacterized phage protein (TIGR01671 family)